jgi:hypothetical protein
MAKKVTLKLASRIINICKEATRLRLKEGEHTAAAIRLERVEVLISAADPRIWKAHITSRTYRLEMAVHR